MYIYACVYVYVYVCIYIHVYKHLYAYLCIDCGFQYQCFSVWTVSCMRMCIRVHMYVRIYIYAFFCSECCMHLGPGVLGTIRHELVGTLHRCVFYTYVHI